MHWSLRVPRTIPTYTPAAVLNPRMRLTWAHGTGQARERRQLRHQEPEPRLQGLFPGVCGGRQAQHGRHALQPGARPALRDRTIFMPDQAPMMHWVQGKRLYILTKRLSLVAGGWRGVLLRGDRDVGLP